MTNNWLYTYTDKLYRNYCTTIKCSLFCSYSG